MVRSGGGGEDDVVDAGPRGRVDDVVAVAQPLRRAGVRVFEDEDQRTRATQGALDGAGIVKAHEPRRSPGPVLVAQPAPVTLVEQRVRLDAERAQMADGRSALVPGGAHDVDRACRCGHVPHPAPVLTGTASDTGVFPPKRLRSGLWAGRGRPRTTGPAGPQARRAAAC